MPGEATTPGGSSLTRIRKPLSLSQKMAVGLGLGVATGLFAGEHVGPLQLAADGYVKLLQMTVLPYVMISLISGLGSLELADARSLASKVGSLLVLLWVIALTAAFMFPVMFPAIETASYFSTTLVEDPQPFDLISLYIPSNPFNSMANNVVPAVVIFSIVLGVALMGVAPKARLLEVLGTANAVMARVNSFVGRLTPYGLFAIVAVAAGTLRLEELARMRVYNVSYVAVSLFVSLWVLPGLVAALTPIRYRDVIGRTRDALLTAFLTSNLFIVLPMLTDEVKRLLGEHKGAGGERHETLPEIIVPASFNFPHTGKLLSLSYVLFAGWFADTAIAVHDYPRLALVGFFTLFGSLNVAIPYLLDLFRIPADTYQLFLASSVVNARFGTLMAAVHTVTIALLGTCAITGVLRVNPRRVLRYLVVTAALAVGTVVATRAVLAVTTQSAYTKDRSVLDKRLLQDHPTATVFGDAQPATPLPPADTSVLQRILSRGAVRVGYFADNPPYAYVNARAELVGFDIEMAYHLAADLGVRLELVAVTREVLQVPADAAGWDLLMAGVAVTPDRASHLLFSASYLDETLAFLVLDHRRAEFSTWASVRALGPIRVGMPPVSSAEAKLRSEAPQANIVSFTSMEQIFTAPRVEADAFMTSAERGSIWTLLHPDYSVVVPRPGVVTAPLAYPIASRDEQLADFINTWIELKRKDGTIVALYDYWILGRIGGLAAPRWSVARDVLHWVN
jgi:Na+/H+-dicarboxylate symporter